MRECIDDGVEYASARHQSSHRSFDGCTFQLELADDGDDDACVLELGHDSMGTAIGEMHIWSAAVLIIMV